MCDPGFDVLTAHDILKILPTKRLRSRLDLIEKVHNDPFSKVPYDILVIIMTHLSIQQRIDLMTASWYVRTQTSDDTFWKWMIWADMLPWFPELQAVFLEAEFSPAKFDFKDIYLFLNFKTNLKLNVRGPLMGIVNRRRIWNAIEPLALSYMAYAQPPMTEDEKNQQAKVILDRAFCTRRPLVLYPQPSNPESKHVQLLRDEVDRFNRKSVFEVSFNKAGALVGLGVVFVGNDRRTFGLHTNTAPEIETQTFSMEGGWLRRIVLHLSDMNHAMSMYGQMSCVKGVEVSEIHKFHHLNVQLN